MCAYNVQTRQEAQKPVASPTRDDRSVASTTHDMMMCDHSADLAASWHLAQPHPEALDAEATTLTALTTSIFCSQLAARNLEGAGWPS